MSPPYPFAYIALMIRIDPPRTAVDGVELSRPALTRFLKRAAKAAGLAAEIEVLLTDDATLRKLNRTWRGKNRPTDVLSFPSADDSGQIAGDLAISLDTAARQAAVHGHTLVDEVRILILHGALHLAGYDHEIDGGEMAARESELRRTLRLPEGLIARSSTQAAHSTQSKAKRSTSPPTPSSKEPQKSGRSAP